ncbi:uncharacterized protein K452DRAFT_274124 [Aplosporella prunicola CBS 121167]|uniref:Uncharacterized protein n=1 Tax=Aplosporella prunicola CBS 121167 TaxID=1176127 RepID=A0A6A6B8A0_9PEZI|nr:uncharacterized protein K452DRAFT_274124 [Aplosporella prunicola CBS 121167]KAF2140379.1 hypothetical protein K452DRAFT_274124 [Aplosporella prunicola CBS 121167]
MTTPATLSLSDDEIDEILYCARANETADLDAYLHELSSSNGSHASASRADLLAAAVDPESGNSALHYAAANGHTDILALIKDALTTTTDPKSAPHAAFINQRNAAGNTALHWACLNGHLAACKQLVALGADAAVLNAAGHDAVFEAEQNGKDDVVAWLLVEGGALDTVVGALRGEEGAGESAGASGTAGAGADADDDDAEGEDVEMKFSVGDTSGPAVESGVEALSLGDDAVAAQGTGTGKGKERAAMSG